VPVLVEVLIAVGLAPPRDVDEALLDEVDASLVGVAVHHALEEGRLGPLEGLDGLLVVRLRGGEGGEGSSGGRVWEGA
jgi:hypothetical protein